MILEFKYVSTFIHLGVYRARKYECSICVSLILEKHIQRWLVRQVKECDILGKVTLVSVNKIDEKNL